MKTAYIAGALAVVVIIGGAWLYGQKENMDTYEPVAYPASYPYMCEDGSEFQVVFAQDMSSILFAPTIASVFPAGELQQVESEQGVRFANDGLSFAGLGETVTLTAGDMETTCTPLPNTEEAPFNFGD